MIADWHTHTIYSHGKGTIRENVETARKKGLKEIAISDHGPKHLTYGIKKSEIVNMRKDIDEVLKEFDDIKVYLSVEANILNCDNFLDVEPEDIKKFDFIIAGYHYGIFNGYCTENYLWNIGRILRKNSFIEKDSKLVVKNTDMVVKSIYTNNIKILTHPGDKAPFDILEIAKACEDRGTYMEINTRHSHMTVDEIKIAKKTDVKFVISSDAHSPKRIADFKVGIDRAMESGLDLSRIVNIEKV